MSRSFWIKAGLGAVGLGLALAGMALDLTVLVWAAVVCLAAAFVVRLVERRASARSEE
jgi:membrane protein implicated in regulation of membrane protease activity